MNDYDVIFSFDLFTIHTTISADDDEQAERYAMQKLTQDEGLNLHGRKYDLTIEKMGEWAR